MTNKPTISSITAQLAIPEEIVPFVQQAVCVLPGEEEAQFFMLFSMMALDLDPQNNIEWFTVIDAACLLWDLQRYRRWKNAIILVNHFPAVKEAMLHTNSNFLLLGCNDMIHAEVCLEYESWRNQPGGGAALPSRLQAMGYSQDGLLASAFAQASHIVTSIEQLMASCRRQYNRVINEAFVRKEFRIRARRFAANKMQLKDQAQLNKSAK